MKKERTEAQKITQDFEDHLMMLHDEYIQLQDKFSEFRGKVITPENHADIESILMAIQQKFGEMYPMINYIMNRHTVLTNVMVNYKDFIDQLKKSGIIVDEKGDEEAKA